MNYTEPQNMRRNLKAPSTLPDKAAIPHEACEQIKFTTWLLRTYPEIKFTSSANGGRRSLSEGVKFKRMGVSAGFPDMEIPFPVKPYHGLYIEFKRISGGVVSEVQKEWLDYLNGKGYYAVVAKGFDAAKEIFLSYITNKPDAA
jgi:hypothetical protein